MKRILLIIVTLLACLPAYAARPSKWIRRAVVAGACAATMLDFTTTVSAIKRGGIETNSLLAGPGSSPKYGRMIGLKVGSCVGQLIGQEFSRNKFTDRLWIGAGAAEIGVFGWAAHHNFHVGTK